MDKMKINVGKQNCRIIGKKCINHFPQLHEETEQTTSLMTASAQGTTPQTQHCCHLFQFHWMMVFLTRWFTNSALVELTLGDVNNCYQNKIKQKEGLGSSKF